MNGLVVQSQENNAVVEVLEKELVSTETIQSIVVSVSEGNSVITETQGSNLVTESLSPVVVQGGVQGPPGVPGASNQFEYFQAGVTVGGNRAVSVNSSGHLVYPDTTSEDTYVVGITTASAGLGELVQVQLVGTQTEPSWSWTPSLPVFVGSNGTLTQTPPTSGQVIIVGYSLTPTKIFIDKQPTVYTG